MKRIASALFGTVALVALTATPATAAPTFASWTADSGPGTMTIAGAATVADAVNADDGAFVQLDDGGWVSFAFPNGWDAAPDGTSAADLTVHAYDALFPADAYVILLNGSLQLGPFLDTSDVGIDLDVLGIGPVHTVTVLQGPTQDPAYPHLGFDLNAVSAANLVPTHVTGTWSQYPTGAPVYQAAVQQPINTANTSNWSSKSKGAIPVKFALYESTGPAAFESILSDGNPDNDYAFASFTPSAALTFGDISVLKTDYTFTQGDCHGGSIRWQVRTGPLQALFIYYGDAPNFTDCTTNTQSGTNMVGLSDLRYDTSQYAGGTFYDTYAHALTLMGSLPVTRVSLVIDGGWAGDQRATISDTTVNDNVYQWDAGGGAPILTCELPDATIEVGKTNPVATGEVNEAAVQASLADSGNAFRVVDCKYMYNLSIPSLAGAGTYFVELYINGARVPTPSSPNGSVRFDIK